MFNYWSVGIVLIGKMYGYGPIHGSGSGGNGFSGDSLNPNESWPLKVGQRKFTHSNLTRTDVFRNMFALKLGNLTAQKMQ